jgi:hypothetical protein
MEHNGRKFTLARIDRQKFDHAAQTGFALQGKHRAQKCEACHAATHIAAAARAEIKVRDPNHTFLGLRKECTGCHEDHHRGQLGNDCTRCHTQDAWKPPSGFDHTRTRFVLTGAHQNVACRKCHGPKPGEAAARYRDLAFSGCQSCHNDPHRGQFAARAAGSDCGSCHTVDGFKPGRFDRAAHNSTGFPLKGKHAELRCVECHKPEGRDAVYKTGKLACAACHEDRHAGEFAGAPWNNQCGSCHQESGFRPTTFSLERHAGTRFPLSGAHTRVACEKCHKSMPDAKPDAQPRQYHFASRSCITCHENRHQTKVACEQCHTTEQWKTTLSFDHSSTTFKLQGAHQTLKCLQCHTGIVFSKASARCASCHAAKDPHRGQFTAAERAEDCSACHAPTRWDGGGFSHESARFTLDVAHRNVACAKCHKMVDNVVVYRGTPRECAQCH